MPLHSSPGNKSKIPSQKIYKKKEKCREGSHCWQSPSLSLLKLGNPHLRACNPISKFLLPRSPLEETVAVVMVSKWRHCFSNILSPSCPSLPTPKTTTPGPFSLCYRKHSRKSSSATLHSSPIRNLLLSHSGNIFSNSKMVLALWGHKQV